MTWRAIFASPLARHVIKRIVNHRFLSYMTSHDVAGNICLALSHGFPVEATREFVDRAVDFIVNEGEKAGAAAPLQIRPSDPRADGDIFCAAARGGAWVRQP